MYTLLIATLIVIGTVIFVLKVDKLERRWVKSMLDWFPAILFAYVIPAFFTHTFGWDLSEVALHKWSRSIIIPLAIVSVMSALSIEQLKIVGWRPIALFAGGSMVIATLPVLISVILAGVHEPTNVLIFDQEYWRGLIPIVGSWIGGSTSQLVLKELTECPEGLFLAVLIIDNVLVNIWTILMFQFIKKSDRINQAFKIKGERPRESERLSGNNLRSYSKVMTLGVVIASGLLIPLLIASFLWQIITLSLLGLALGNFVKGWDHALVLKMGGVLIVLIMAILGLRLNFSNFSLPILFVVVILVWLILHFVFMLMLAYFLKVHMAWVPIASMANLGGISTTPAVTAAYEVKWMPHAILLAILSMVTGTAWGMLTFWLFNMVTR